MGNTKLRLPEHIRTTQRQWKKQKRAEWKAVIRAAETFLLGAHYTPVEILPILGLLRDQARLLSAKEWGR
jgi:hypothetical protein